MPCESVAGSEAPAPSPLSRLPPPAQGDDSLFKAKFCVAYQSMSTIGFQFPADYAAIAPQFVLS